MRAADITTSQAVGHLSPGEIERMVQVAAQMKADDDKVLDDTFMCNMCVCVLCTRFTPCGGRRQMHARIHDSRSITCTHARIHAHKVVARLEARTELEHMLYACKDEAEARGSARLEALAQSVEEWLDGVEAGAVEVAVVCL